MKVYHGSNVEVSSPDIKHSRRAVDFSQGFYVTTLHTQAEKWCQKYKLRGQNAILSYYGLDEKDLNKCKVLKFSEYNEEWLDFILTCRRGKDTTDYDIVIGGVANDNVFNTVELFFAGLIDKKEALKRLKYEKPNLQICLRKQRIIDRYLEFLESEKL